MDQWDLRQESAHGFKNGYFDLFKYDFCIQFFNACQTISFAWSIERKRPTNVSTKYTGCSNWILDAIFKWLSDVTPSHITSLDVTPAEVRTLEVLTSGHYTFGKDHMLAVSPSKYYTFGSYTFRCFTFGTLQLRKITPSTVSADFRWWKIQRCNFPKVKYPEGVTARGETCTFLLSSKPNLVSYSKNILKTHFTEPLQNLWSFYGISNRIVDLDGKVWNKRIACLKMSHFKSIVIRCGNISHKCYFTAEKRLASQNATLDLWRSQQGNNLLVCSTAEW